MVILEMAMVENNNHHLVGLMVAVDQVVVG